MRRSVHGSWATTCVRSRSSRGPSPRRSQASRMPGSERTYMSREASPIQTGVVA